MTWQFRKTNGAEPRDICEVHRDVDVVTNLKDSKGLCWLPRTVQPADVHVLSTIMGAQQTARGRCRMVRARFGPFWFSTWNTPYRENL